MGKKSIKEAAAAGTSVFNQLASGNIQDAKDAQNVQDGKHLIGDRSTDKHGVPVERLNLKIPTEIKEYLTVAAARASIEKRSKYTITTYLIELIKRDMELHKDE